MESLVAALSVLLGIACLTLLWQAQTWLLGVRGIICCSIGASATTFWCLSTARSGALLGALARIVALSNDGGVGDGLLCRADGGVVSLLAQGRDALCLISS